MLLYVACEQTDEVEPPTNEQHGQANPQNTPQHRDAGGGNYGNIGGYTYEILAVDDTSYSQYGRDIHYVTQSDYDHIVDKELGEYHDGDGTGDCYDIRGNCTVDIVILPEDDLN